MTIDDIGAVLEDEFHQTFVTEAKGPKRPVEDRRRDLAARLKAANMKRSDIGAQHDNRPLKVEIAQARPTTTGYVIPSKRDREKSGAKVQTVQIPATVTLWHVEIPAIALDVDLETFRERYAKDAAESLATQGMDLGLTHFAPLEVRDRPRKVTKPNDSITNVRERALVVIARGWKA